MITEIVSFKIPAGMSRDAVLKDAKQTLDRWRGFPGLVRKTYLMADAETCVGIYMWETKDHARAGHDADWFEKAEERWGNRPTVTYCDTLMVLDNSLNQVVEYPPAT
jgi:heme-degrading monooxygenase HmoA